MQVVLETPGERLGGAYRTDTDIDDAIHVGGDPTRGDTCFVPVQVHHEAAREHPPREVGIGEIEHDVPRGALGALQLGDLDGDHDDDDEEEDEEDEGDDDEDGDDDEGRKELTSRSSALTVDTTRPSMVPPSTA